MSDKKISQLTASTTPLAGTEVLPIVQGGSTVNVSVSNLTAGRSVAMLSATSTNDLTVNGMRVGVGGGNNTTNTAVGFQAINASATGGYGVCVGYFAGRKITTGIYNVAVGFDALSNAVTATANTAVGGSAMQSATGGDNTGIGYAALTAVAGGVRNTAVGSTALIASTGNNNTAVGKEAGSTATTGSNNAFFGYNAQPSSVTVSNEYTYGNSAVTKHRFVGGDIVIGTAGKGIDFSADGQAAGMTSELLDDYEEGDWTPVLTGSTSGSITFSTPGRYTKVGNIVTIELYDSNIDASTPLVGNITLTGIPFSVFRLSPASVFYANLFGVTNLYAAVVGSSVSFTNNANSTSVLTESSVSALSGRRLALSCTYRV